MVAGPGVREQGPPKMPSLLGDPRAHVLRKKVLHGASGAGGPPGRMGLPLSADLALLSRLPSYEPDLAAARPLCSPSRPNSWMPASFPPKTQPLLPGNASTFAEADHIGVP